MALYHLLRDRKAINILKLLYDNEIIKKKFSLNLSKACEKLAIDEAEASILNLVEYNLVTTDALGDDKVMSITNKGKEFIEAFDHMIEIIEGKRAKPKSVHVRYELTIHEKKVLVLTHKISNEIGSEHVAVKALVMEMYPHHAHNTRIGIVSKNINRLEELNLIETTKQNETRYLRVTDKGEKTIIEQHLRGIVY